MMRFKILTINEYDERSQVISTVDKSEHLHISNKELNFQKKYATRLGNGKSKYDFTKDKTLSNSCQISLISSNVFNLDDVPEEDRKRMTINQMDFFN